MPVAAAAAGLLAAGGCGDVVIHSTTLGAPLLTAGAAGTGGGGTGGGGTGGGGGGGTAGMTSGGAQSGGAAGAGAGEGGAAGSGGTGGGSGAGGAEDAGVPVEAGPSETRVLVEPSDITRFYVDGAPTTSDLITVDGQSFNQAWQAMFTGTPVNEWDSQLIIPLTQRVEANDVIVASFSARCATPPVGQSECTSVFVFEEAADPWTKYAASQFYVGYEWTPQTAAFTVARAFDPGAAHMVLRLGYEGQMIQLGNFSVIDYGSDAATGDPDAAAP